MKFNLLCKELKISSDQPESEQLALLKQWFQEHISRDIQYKGTEKEQIALYKEFTEKHLDNFLPESFSDVEKKNAHLEEKNLIGEAATLGLDRIILSLQPSNAALNKVNTYGMTPLHIAAARGYLHTVEALLSLGADPSLPNKQNQYPLFSALFVPVLHEEELIQNKIKIFRLLLEKGNTDLKHPDQSGDTVLHQMACVGFDVLINDLLKKDERIAHETNNFSHYPLHMAILNNKPECVKLLLQVQGAETMADNKGLVPLHYAARFGGIDILESCCAISTNLNPKDKEHRTPLMLAASAGRLFAVKLLIERGAEKDLKDGRGWTVLDHAKQSGNSELIEWLNSN